MFLGSVGQDPYDYSSLVDDVSSWPQEELLKSDHRALLVNSDQHVAVLPQFQPHNATPSRSLASRGNGYVLAYHYSDQLTAGALNLLSLQCWTAGLGSQVKVVEPFIRNGSYWGVEASLLRNSTGVPRLRDIFDRMQWKMYAKRKQMSKLASWEEFLQGVPRRLILVGMACKKLDKNFQDFAVKLANGKGFRIVREVCTDGETVFSAARFQAYVYANYTPSDAVVLFSMWSGISETLSQPPLRYRIPISDMQRCERNSQIKKFMDSIPQSRRLVNNAKIYIERYLSSSSNDGLVPLKRLPGVGGENQGARESRDGYIAVMFRLEQLFVRRKLKSEADRLEGGRRCVNSILREVSAVKEHGPLRVFLAMDSGKYGSYKFRRKNDTIVHQLSQSLFNGLYPSGSMSYSDWEATFSSVADFITPGYIAMLQLSVAVRSSDLLLAGRGSFQSIAEREVKFQHASNARVHLIKGC